MTCEYCDRKKHWNLYCKIFKKSTIGRKLCFFYKDSKWALKNYRIIPNYQYCGIKIFGLELITKLGKKSNKEIRYHNGKKYCLWCGEYLIGRKRKFCCKEHSDQFYSEWCRRYDWSTIRYLILERDNYICQHCDTKKSKRELEVHHIIPRCKGGSDKLDNLITLCTTCHKKETKKLLEEINSGPRPKYESKIIPLKKYFK